MTDKSAFTDDEWKALTEAPLLVTLALFAAGEHGPISMVKEASASARTIAHPPAGRRVHRRDRQGGGGQGGPPQRAPASGGEPRAGHRSVARRPRRGRDCIAQA